MLCFPDNGTVLKQAGRQTAANSYHDGKKKKKKKELVSMEVDEMLEKICNNLQREMTT